MVIEESAELTGGRVLARKSLNHMKWPVVVVVLSCVGKGLGGKECIALKKGSEELPSWLFRARRLYGGSLRWSIPCLLDPACPGRHFAITNVLDVGQGKAQEWTYGLLLCPEARLLHLNVQPPTVLGSHTVHFLYASPCLWTEWESYRLLRPAQLHMHLMWENGSSD